MPLTTAAAEFVKDGQFTGQDVCYYTAPVAETTIRINRAMNILADQAEFEIERARNVATFFGDHYDLVGIRGELKLRSKLTESVDVEVTKELSGEVLKKFPETKDVRTAKGLKRVNPKHLLLSDPPFLTYFLDSSMEPSKESLEDFGHRKVKRGRGGVNF